MLFHHFDWDLTHQVLLFIFCLAIIWTWDARLEDAHTLFQNCIWSCKLSAKVSLVLDNPFSVPSLWKLNHISVCFIQISTKTTCKQLILFRENHVFFLTWSAVFWVACKFQHNVKISIKTARASQLSVSLWLCLRNIWKNKWRNTKKLGSIAIIFDC